METTNPYSAVGAQYSAGLAAIITGLPGSPTLDQLAEEVKDFVITLGYTESTPAAEGEIITVAKNAVNSYLNGQLGSFYNGIQKGFAGMLTGPAFTSYLTVDTLDQRIIDVEEVVTESGLSVDAQTPLLLATTMGQNAYAYLLAEIALGAGSGWNAYWSGALTSPTANVPFWTAAAMEGALIGDKMSPRGMIAPTVNIVSIEIASALTAALMITSAKIIFLLSRRMKAGSFMKAEKAGCGCGH